MTDTDSTTIPKARHSPAPWTVSKPWAGFASLRDGNGALVFGLAAGDADERQPADVCAANASLLAASPDMLEALKSVAAYWDVTGFGDCEPDCDCLDQAVKRAIAKAETR